jgi:hypothetical protein
MSDLDDLRTEMERNHELRARIAQLEVELAESNASTSKHLAWMAEQGNIITQLRAELAAMRERDAKPLATCQWTEGSEGEWNTECGACWVFDDQPDESDNVYCSKCGRKITLKKWCAPWGEPEAQP